MRLPGQSICRACREKSFAIWIKRFIALVPVAHRALNQPTTIVLFLCSVCFLFRDINNRRFVRKSLPKGQVPTAEWAENLWLQDCR